MKSLIEEASTITKAVEKAWVRAGKPAEFTIKVFEEPKYNFLGMTTKSAKVAIFFKSTEAAPLTNLQEKRDIKTPAKEQSSKNRSPRAPQEQPNARTPYHKNYNTEAQSDRNQRPPVHRTHKDESRVTREHPKQPESNRDQRELRENSSVHQPRSRGPQERRPYKERQERPEAVWSNEMADIAQDWLENMLTILEKREHLVQAKIVGPNLKFEFRQPLLEDKDKEKLLFASWAHLILATVGNKYKKDLRGLKIVLSSSIQ